MRYGYGLGALMPSRPLAAAAVNLAMTQLANYQTFQRATLTGGAINKGTGSVPLSITASAATPVYVRLRRVSDDAIQQPAYQAATAAQGTGTVTLANVPAINDWCYLDIAPTAAGPWTLGTARMAVGAITGFGGQSQPARTVAKQGSGTGTIASLGVTVSDKGVVYATYDNMLSPQWQLPSDSGLYRSTFAAEFLRRENARKGVICAYVGHAVGSTAIATWQPGETNNVNLRAILDAVGGFEDFWWYQGGSNNGTTGAAYKTGLDGVFGDLAAHNAARGTNFGRLLTATATRTGDGTTDQVQTIRKAQAEWAAANSGIYMEPHDVVLDDDVHQSQAGNIVLAHHLSRAVSGVSLGPVLTGATRGAGSATLNLTFSLPAGATGLVEVGDFATRLVVYNAGDTTTPLALAASDPFVVGAGGAATLKLAAAPAGAVDVYLLRHPDPSQTTAYDHMLYDNRTGDLPRGGQVQPTVLAPVRAADPGQAFVGLLDTFTDPDATPLASHTGESGHGWTATTGTWAIADGGAYPSALGVATCSFDPASANYDIQSEHRFYSLVNNNQYIALHIQDASNLYYVGYGRAAGNFQIGRVLAGTSTIGQSVAPSVTFAAGDSFTCEISVRTAPDPTNANTVTTTITATWKQGNTVIGTLTYKDTSAALQPKGKIGLRQSGSASTSTTGLHYQRLAAQDVA